MSQAIKAILDAAATVTGDLANGADSIMHLMEVQGEGDPYVVLNSQIVNPNDTQSGQVIDEWEVSILIVSRWLYTEGEEAGAHNIAGNIRTALHDTSGTYAGSNVAGIVFDDQSPAQIFKENSEQKIQIEQTYRMWVNR